ncbi:glycosyl hydrolase family 61-domain-containing protein [Xylariaceae sp. FL0016]|nr:glycosyl hydrolase family 61-domain-containing protein [Xylariaceae sp. FL0016]
MSSFKTTVATVGVFATSVLAHGTVSGFVADGTYNAGFTLDDYYEKQNSGSFPDTAGWYAENTDNGFVSPDAYGTADINCHINAEPGALTSTVSAGGTVDFQWTTWPHGIGPVLTYVAACDGDCSAADKTALKWVKIDESGYDADTETWAAQSLIDNNNTWTTTVPSGLASGNYVFRHEIIALHGASEENGAQNYPQCMNIAITGGGSDSPDGTLGTELYSADDAGILFNPYGTITSYEIPGPALYSGASSGSGSGSGSASSTTAATATTASASATKAVTTTAPAATTTTSAAQQTSAKPTTLVTSTKAAATTTTAAQASATGGSSTSAAALYEQCGGANWTGATTCSEGTCTSYNDYYSQCV